MPLSIATACHWRRVHRFLVAGFAALSAACASPTSPPGCTLRLASGCWTFLGLDSEWVTALADTPWGLYAGTHDHGVFRMDWSSHDWSSAGLVIERGYISALLYTPTDPPRLLAAIGPKADSAGQDTKAAVYATEDGGKTWLPWDGGLEGRLFAARGTDAWAYSLTVDPGNPSRLYMGLLYPVMRSDDGGETWQFVWGTEREYGGWMGVYALLVSEARDGHVWAGGETALFTRALLRSIDWGDTWTFVDPTPRNEGGVFALAEDPRARGRLLAGGSFGVLRSDDAGVSWQISLTTPDAGLVRGLCSLGQRLYAVSEENSRPGPGGLGNLTDLGLYLTEDGGGSWDTLAVPTGAGGAEAFLADSTRGLLIGTRRGAQSSGVWSVQP